MKAKCLSMFFALSLAACALTGEGGLLDSGADFGKLPDGRHILLDTPRMWRRWTDSVDSEIPREVSYRNGTSQMDSLKGKPQGGGAWNGYWLRRISALQSGHQEHPQKYADYIIEQRRRVGLPELNGYP